MDERVWSQYDHLSVKSLKIGDVEIDPNQFGGKKLSSISPLKAGSDADAVAKKINEVIAAMKIAGIMENK